MPRKDPDTPRGDAYAARIRAAAAYADLDRTRLGERLGGLSKETISALFAGESQSDRELRERIADVCGVPVWFLENGYEAQPVPEDPTVAERVEALEHRAAADKAQLEGQLTQLRADLAKIAARRMPRRPGAQEPGGTGRSAG